VIIEQGQRPIRAVLDLNIIVSATIVPRGPAFHTWNEWRAGRFTLLISRGMIVELTGKLTERRIAERYRFPQEYAWRTASVLRSADIVIDVPGHEVVAVTGDPEDDLVLATCRLTQADYLVTRDRRLLGLGNHEGTAIVDPSDFLRILARSPQ